MIASVSCFYPKVDSKRDKSQTSLLYQRIMFSLQNVTYIVEHGAILY
jgi:hypothetical protein